MILAQLYSRLKVVYTGYAMEAISHAGTVLDVLATDGVVLAAEKKVTGELLGLSEVKEDRYRDGREKIFLVNSKETPYGDQLNPETHDEYIP